MAASKNEWMDEIIITIISLTTITAPTKLFVKSHCLALLLTTSKVPGCLDAKIGALKWKFGRLGHDAFGYCTLGVVEWPKRWRGPSWCKKREERVKYHSNGFSRPLLLSFIPYGKFHWCSQQHLLLFPFVLLLLFFLFFRFLVCSPLPSKKKKEIEERNGKCNFPTGRPMLTAGSRELNAPIPSRVP